jgi:hypothetical protein
MAIYSITIDRWGKHSGTLLYTGTFEHNCDCWWDATDAIPAGVYGECSATHLAAKTNSKGEPREGIFFPNVEGRKGIFIHYWPGPGSPIGVWSDGCTCILEPDMLKIWNDIFPKDGKNVTITVKDSPPTTGCIRGQIPP